MKNNNAFERCLTFINCQLSPATGALSLGEKRMAVTISRQTGSGAFEIAEKLAKDLQKHNPGERHWTVFDRDLMEKVLEEHHLPKYLAKFLPEDRALRLNDILDELFGLHPATWTVARHAAETILHLAELGSVIIIGRGATAITAKLPNVVHVRFVGSLERRLERIQRQNQLTLKEAREFIRRSDLGRGRYLKTYFKKDINDPELYDLMINTDRISGEDAARMIGELVLLRAQSEVRPRKTGMELDKGNPRVQPDL